MVVKGAFAPFVKVAVKCWFYSGLLCCLLQHRELLLRSWSSCVITLALICTIKGKTSLLDAMLLS